MKDSWGRPRQSVYDLTSLKQGELSALNNSTEESTSTEVDDWMEKDYFMSMKFDPLVMFVVIPALIQLTVFGAMLMMFVVINLGLTHAV